MKKYAFSDDYGKESKDFKVKVNGENIEVYGCDVSAYPMNRVWPGKQREQRQTEPASFVMLGSDGEVTLEIETEKAFEKAVVRPLSKNITAKPHTKGVEVTFNGPGQYSVEFDNMHQALIVFINPEKEFDINPEDENVMYFGKGVHIIDERIELCDNQTLFIDEGAVLYGSINAEDKQNIKVVGYGILDNSRMQRANEINGCAVLAPDAGKMTGNPIFFSRCKNVTVEGVTIVNSSGWNIYLDGCENVIVDNIKLIGQWRYNADGCDFCNCTNGILRNSFLRTFDDCVTVKGFKLNNHLPVQNILAENLVLWCDWGKALEVGAETCAPYMDTITFRNCDIIHGSIVMLDVHQGDGADIDNVRFEDIRIEYSGNEMMPMLQEEDNQEYKFFGEKAMPVWFMLTSGVTMWSIDNYSGDMRNIYFKDISITSYDDKIPQGSKITPDIKYSKIDGVYFENITINGKKCDSDMLGIKICDGAYNIFLDGKIIN